MLKKNQAPPAAQKSAKGAPPAAKKPAKGPPRLAPPQESRAWSPVRPIHMSRLHGTKNRESRLLGIRSLQGESIPHRIGICLGPALRNPDS